MPLRNLNHVLVLADDLDATRDFYVDILGLTVGDRPPFNFPGYWIYLDDQAVVHLAPRSSDRGGRAPSDPTSDGPDTGPIDHVAFEATGLKDMIARLDRHGVAARHRTVPDAKLHQIFVHDPNGVLIELNYPAAEGAELDA